LLFPFITNANGFETGIAIANTSQDPLKKAGELTAARSTSINQGSLHPAIPAQQQPQPCSWS